MNTIITPAQEGAALREMIDYALRNRLRTVSMEDDQEFRELVRHCLKPGEKLGEFTSRTGLGKGNILAQNMTPSQIKDFCDRADERRKDDVIEHFAEWKPKPVPTRFVIDE